MKILFDHQIFSLQQYGGVSDTSFEIANRIAALGEHEVDVFAPLFVNRHLSTSGAACLHGIRVPYFPYVENILGAVNRGAAELFLKRRRSTDIVHETYYSQVDCYPRSAKRVTTVHDMIHEKFANNFPPQDKTQQAKRRAVEQADHVICVSQNTKKDLIELMGVPEKKISVVCHGFSLAMSDLVPKPVN